MKIETIVLGAIQTNCYLVSAENAALVIDPGEYDPRAAAFLKENAACQRLILLTHSHYDHICGAPRLREETGVPIAVGARDAAALGDPAASLSDYFGGAHTPFAPDRTLSDGETVTVGTLTLEVLETPGHTPGGVCFLAGDVLFSGDTLFADSVGRTDFPGGDTPALLRSLSRLSALGDGVRVYPGHGGETTVGHEKRCNPYMRASR